MSFKRGFIQTSFWVMIIIMAASCIQGPGGGKRKTASKVVEASSSDTYTPDFSENTYTRLKNQSDETTSTLTINIDFNDNIYMLGRDVHNFISNGNQSSAQCLVAHYNSTLVTNKILVIAVRPNYFLNFSTGLKEYYYLIAPSDSNTNKAFCQKTGIIGQMNAIYPGETIAYSLSELSVATTTSIITDHFALYSIGGSHISTVKTDNLSLKINAQTSIVDPVKSCTTTDQCIAKGYDCCSTYQCVNDGELKDGTDTSSSDYLQAVSDIQNNNATFRDYPNFFHICGVNIPPTPSPTPTVNPADEAARRLQELKELYECTTLLEGEMSICTATHSNVSQNTIYETGKDDRNFRTTQPDTSTLPDHSITEIIYSGETLFAYGEVYNPSNGKFTISQKNDTITDAAAVTITASPGDNAPNNDLRIRYKIDGSCKQINSQLAKCTKYYVQGQNSSPARIDDHPDGTDVFLLPLYADITKQINVEVDGIYKIKNIHWEIATGSPSSVRFTGTGQQVYDTQSVTITYYVSSGSIGDVLQQKQTSVERIDAICDCGGSNDCTLEPVTENRNGIDTVVNYKCVYPDNNESNVPLQQIVYISPKTVPVRFFNKQGVSKTSVTIDTEQEGSLFEYIKDNLLKPNNIFNSSETYDTDQYIGFNEIYGPLTYKTESAKPATEIRVTKGKTYDIYVDSGAFSSCYYCGNDYYSQIAKLFPATFNSRGGGYTPDASQTNRLNTQVYRADDLLFGRACFVPVTMIPWTHRFSADRQQQRLRRLEAQHFLFANGYQRDWYGFDYGSMIGSFDGVKWFSVGDKRRIKAESSKLFLAVNAWFGDLTLNNQLPFRTTIQDTTTVIGGDTSITSDFDSKGAQCQQYHICQTDSDCVAQLGWEYTCQTITGITTKWPVFDENALEKPDQEQELRITQLVGNTTGSSKRCVYRSAGAPCHTNLDYILTNINGSQSSYARTTIPGLNTCTGNNYCQTFRNTNLISKFNNKIARFGKSVKYVNISSDVPISDAHEVGKGSPIIGRPFKFNGSKSIYGELEGTLNQNNVSSLCIHGRNPANSNFLETLEAEPESQHSGDRILGIGMTPSGNGPYSHYLSSCSILDSNDNFYLFNSSNYSVSPIPQLNTQELVWLAGTQSIPANSLAIFESDSLTGNDSILKDFVNDHITSTAFQENSCLRAPNSSCHTDLDCATSWYSANKIGSLTPENYAGILNKYEIQFWQENMVCSQEYPSTDSNFALKNNRCCRDTGMELSVGTLHGDATSTDTDGTNFDPSNLPGLDIALNNSARYSRISTIYYEMKSNPGSYPSLQAAMIDQCSSGGGCMNTSSLDKQYQSFATINERSCCTGHWVRNFHSTNGGGHDWHPSKFQKIEKSSFLCYNWSQCSGVTCGPNFTCDHTELPDDPNCRAVAVRDSQTEKIFDWLSSLELTGIPQIKIKNKNHADIMCRVAPSDQSIVGTTPPPDIISFTNTEEYKDISGNRYFSSIDENNFGDNMKTIFSPDTISCCIPAGDSIAITEDSGQCCTGFAVATNDPNYKRCALRDYADVTVYLNRYVSSAAKTLDSSYFDTETGYIADQSALKMLACLKNICASGVLADGITVNNYKIPGKHSTSDYEIRRFLASNDINSDNYQGLADLYDEGLKWNTHVYCFPESGSSLSGSDKLNIVECE